jgi:hypothetical protein
MESVLIRATISVALLFGTALRLPSAAEPIVIDSTHQLFLDDYLIASLAKDCFARESQTDR